MLSVRPNVIANNPARAAVFKLEVTEKHLFEMIWGGGVTLTKRLRTAELETKAFTQTNTHMYIPN